MTTDRQNDVEDLIAALRDDLPNRDDERRVRARLVAGGMAVGSLTLAQIGSAAAGHTAAASTAASSAVGSGTVLASSAAATGGASAAGSLSIAAGTAGTQGLAAVFGKAALVTALAVGAGYPVVSQLLPPAAPAPVAAAAIASEAEGAAEAAGATQPVVPVGRAQVHAERPAVLPPAEARALVGAEPRRAPALQVRSRSTQNFGSRAELPAPGTVTSSSEGAVEPNSTARVSTLEAETALIERALRAARMGDNDTASRWLSEHQYRYPNGALAPERQRALEQLQRQ